MVINAFIILISVLILAFPFLPAKVWDCHIHLPDEDMEMERYIEERENEKRMDIIRDNTVEYKDRAEALRELVENEGML